MRGPMQKAGKKALKNLRFSLLQKNPITYTNLHMKNPLFPPPFAFSLCQREARWEASHGRRHGTLFCFFPPQNSDKSHETHTQLPQPHMRSAREGYGAEIPRHPGAELQRRAANKQQRFAAVCSREVSTQRWHDPRCQRQRTAPALTVCFIHRQV